MKKCKIARCVCSSDRRAKTKAENTRRHTHTHATHTFTSQIAYPETEYTADNNNTGLK